MAGMIGPSIFGMLVFVLGLMRRVLSYVGGAGLGLWRGWVGLWCSGMYVMYVRDGGL